MGLGRGPMNVEVWQDVVKKMKEAEPLSGDAHDDALYSRIAFGVESLDAKVRRAFLDIASFYDPNTEWEIVERLVGHHHLDALQQRGLVQKAQPESEGDQSTLVEIHDVILALASKMIKEDTQELRITGDDFFKQIVSTNGDLKLVVALKHVDVEALPLQQMPRLLFLKYVTVVRKSIEEGAQLRDLSVVEGLIHGTDKLFDLKECTCLQHLHWSDVRESASKVEFLGHPKVSEQLRVLDLSLWTQLKDVGVIETLRCLKRLHLWGCVSLETLPEGLSSLTGLENLHLGDCESMRCLPDGIGALESLTLLDLLYCRRLQCLPESVRGLKSLRKLSMSWCDSLESLPKGVAGMITSLVELDLSYCTSLQCLPESVRGLKSLRKLDMYNCKSLESLPKGVAGMTSLVELVLSRCSKLESLPEELACLTCLRKLDMRNCDSLESLPKGVAAGMSSLVELDLSCCRRLQCLPESVRGLKSLRKLDMSWCESLESLPKGVAVHEIRSLTGLKALELSSCEALYALMQDETFCPDVLGMVTEVELSWSRCFPYLPKSLPCFTSLKRLQFDGDGVNLQLFLPQQLTSLTALDYLSITNCRRVQSLPPGITSLRGLTRLEWNDCSSLQSLQEIAGMTGLERLTLTRCASRKHSMLKEIWTLTGLRWLDLSGWENMRVLYI